MHIWNVAGALLMNAHGLLLVRNERPTGISDWTTPGGVIDESDASVLHGLAREVEEETGLIVSKWAGQVYAVRADAPDMDWSMRCEVHLAETYGGDLRFTDPDGIVVDAAYVHASEVAEKLTVSYQWVREPLETWIAERWPLGEVREFHYVVRGTSREEFTVERLA